MKFKSISLFILGGLVVFLAFRTLARQQKQKPMKSSIPSGSYLQMWSTIDSLEGKGLSKSALEEVMKVYQKAKQEHNSPELVKAVIHRIKFQSYTEENAIVKITRDLKAELKDASYPEKPLLHSMTAEIYWQYYQRNRYRILNRTETVNYKNDDIETWAAAKFVDVVLKEYDSSLRDAGESKRIQINVFDPVLTNGNAEGRKFRPTLYDFLAHRALAFYMNEESGLTRPADRFEMNSAFYLNNADMFLNFMLTSKDTADFKFKAIALMQELISFHHDDAHPGALIDADLMRLKFVREHLTIPTKDSLYNLALQQIADRYKDYPGSTEALHEQALLALNEGNKYPEKREEKYKWKIIQAEKFCDEAIARFPYSDGGIRCKALKKQINETSLSFVMEEINVPGQAFRAKVDYQNIGALYFRIVKDSKNPGGDEIQEDQEARISRYLKSIPVQEWKVELPVDTDKQQHSIEVSLPALPPGRYAILLSANQDFSSGKKSLAYSQCRISAIGLVHRRLEEGATEIYLYHRDSGQPMPDVLAKVFVREYNYSSRKYISRETDTYLSDAEGKIVIPVRGNSYRNFNVEFVRGEDHLFLNEGFYQYPGQQNPERKLPQTFFFTDRSIYRPGQTIYFKGIMLQGKDEESGLLTGRSTKVQLYDVNGQKAQEQDFITSENGTFHGSFTAPQGGLNGQMRIQNECGSTYFSVEEYKRPKFEVTFEPVKGVYRLGGEVTVTAQAEAFSGQAVDGAKVQYRIVRMARYPDWCYWKPFFNPNIPEQVILNGETKTDDKGRFAVAFVLQPDLSIPKENEPIFTYKITADVTDINGETRSGENNVSAAYSSLELNTDIGREFIFQKKDSFSLFSKNLSGEHADAVVQLVIHKLKTPDRILRKRLWSSADKHSLAEREYIELFPYDVYADEDDESKWGKAQQVWKAELNTARDSVVHLRKNDFPPGKYKLEGTTTDQFGQMVRLEQTFLVIDPEATALPMKMPDWFTVLRDDAPPGSSDNLLIGSAEKNVRVLYELELKGKIISKQWIDLDRNQQLVSIPVTEAYRGNFTVYFTFVKRGRVFTHSHTMNVPWDNKDLKIQYETFRSKLTPGQKEEWRLKISGSKGEKASAEMLASMYDASLDLFRPHAWNFSVYNRRAGTMEFRSGGFGVEQSHWYDKREPEKPEQHHFRNYDELNWFGFETAKYGRMYKGVPMNMPLKFLKEEGAGMSAEMSADAIAMPQALSVADSQTTEPKAGSGVPEQQAPVSVRRNLSETAFFYPQLFTNDSGEVILSFTSPEALTKWKFMAFAHTNDLKFALEEKEVITQKQLMVTPNAPRFLREGDRILFPAKISSLSDTLLAGKATLQLFDAVTMEPLDSEFGNATIDKKFSLRKGESASVNWELKIPEGKKTVLYRVTAVAGNYSDGEEQPLPVVSNKQLVTESLPLWQREYGEKTFELSKLVNNTSPSLRNLKLTLEYTSNPAWSAIQALPYMMEYPYQCSEQIFSRYYANSIATHLANSTPRIKAVFESWKSASPGAFLSNLEKNQELKSLLLEETPWVMEAKDEGERKKRVGLLFDLNKMSQELSSALNQLRKAQSSNGGWPWFENMPEDRYITQHIVAGMGHLDHLGIKSVREDSRCKEMVEKAIVYLDQRLAEDFLELKKEKAELEKVKPGATQIHYLYARSYFKDIPIGKGKEEAHEFYLKQMKKYWPGNGEYLEGMIALTLFRSNETAVAQDILKSLKENSQNNEEMGMYWAGNTGGFLWSRASVETQALLIEAFDEITNDQQAVGDMKVWLLRQKQTQDWKTTKATAEACYALLLRGSDWLAETKRVRIEVGTATVDMPANAESGTGYFKTSWTGKEISNGMGKVKLRTLAPLTNAGNENTGLSWGALYWQYFESLDKITPHATPLSLKKELFIERATNQGPVIELLQGSTQLKVGDRIKVRIELRVDRDMEYVHMKDMRASGLEPENVLSEYKWQDGLGYYESTRDASTNFFFSYLRKGVYVFEYPLRATQQGEFSNGITSIQCMYSPEFAAHSSGERIKIIGK